MKIKVLLVMENKEVQTIKIPASLKFIKSFIGQNLYRIRINQSTMIIANQDAQIHEFNRILQGNIILGKFIIVGIKNNCRVSLKKKQLRKFTNMFNLNKQQKKIDRYKEEFLEEFYCKQREMKQKNAERNKKEIFNIAA